VLLIELTRRCVVVSQVDVRFQLMFDESNFDDGATKRGGSEAGRLLTLAPPSPRAAMRAPVTPLTAINYDYAMAFPRTLADSGVRRQKKSIVERFRLFPLWSPKEEYVLGGIVSCLLFFFYFFLFRVHSARAPSFTLRLNVCMLSEIRARIQNCIYFFVSQSTHLTVLSYVQGNTI